MFTLLAANDNLLRVPAYPTVRGLGAASSFQTLREFRGLKELRDCKTFSTLRGSAAASGFQTLRAFRGLETLRL